MKKVCIVGTGNMAIEYFKVLKKFDVAITVVGNHANSCEKFTAATGVKCFSGGFENWIQKQDVPSDKTIVAVSEQNLGSVTKQLLLREWPSILVEKPGGANFDELEELLSLQKKSKSKVYIGYNRRHYASVQIAKRLIAEDGGAESLFFEFTEWGHVVREKVCPQLVKDEWFWHNSTHVVDLAFYLCGFPKKMESRVSGKLDWCSGPRKYAGTGETGEGALFSYLANWAAPGRWGIEVMTNKRRFIFRPLEKLLVQKIGSVSIEEVPIENALDLDFKPGLFKQTKHFLEENVGELLTLESQASNAHWYKQIFYGSLDARI